MYSASSPAFSSEKVTLLVYDHLVPVGFMTPVTVCLRTLSFEVTSSVVLQALLLHCIIHQQKRDMFWGFSKKTNKQVVIVNEDCQLDGLWNQLSGIPLGEFTKAFLDTDGEDLLPEWAAPSGHMSRNKEAQEESRASCLPASFAGEHICPLAAVGIFH